MNLEEIKARYTISEPSPPVSLIALAVTLILGLLALFFAAYTAFAQVQEPAHAFFSAALIEIGAVVESIALVRGKNRIAITAATHGYLRLSFSPSERHFNIDQNMIRYLNVLANS